MVKNKIQSVEPQVAQKINGWLESYNLPYYLQQASMDSEIDSALKKSESKTGGKGGNLPDAKMMLTDSNLITYPIMIEYKGYENKLEILDKNNNVFNADENGNAKYNNIKEYAVNGAVHYANAILQYTSYTEVIAIGVTGYLDETKILQLKIGVYYVSKSNYGVGKKVDEYKDLSFLKKEFFDNFIKKVKLFELSEVELKRIHTQRELLISNALNKINEDLFKNKEISFTAQSRINLVAACIMANLGVPGKVKALQPSELASKEEENETDSDVIKRKIDNFLKEKKLPDLKRNQIVNTLALTLYDEKLYKKRKQGCSLIKEIFTEIVDELGFFIRLAWIQISRESSSILCLVG